MYSAIAGLRRTTHTHVIGGSRSGKSKFLEWLIRNDLAENQPFCVIDWHGTLYQDVLKYLAYTKPRREFVLLNPAMPDWITGFNPFTNTGQDTSALVARRVGAVARAWGVTDTNEMPTFERLASLVFDFAVRSGETLPNAALLLRRHKKELRRYAIQITTDSHMREEWWELSATAKREKDWHYEVLALRNRLMRFLKFTGIRRFMGLKDGNVEIRQALEGGKNVLVNLAQTDFLDRQSAGVFAALLLNEFFEAAMARAGTKKLYTLYLDEFQEYITPDLGAMLDQVLKGGLHLVLAHHHLGQLHEDARLRKSIFQNAGMRFVFGMRDVEDSELLAKQILLNRVNERDIKQKFYSVRMRPLQWTGQSTSKGEYGETVTLTDHLSLIPDETVESGVAEASTQEKVLKVAEEFTDMEQRRCFAKLDRAKAVKWEVPFMEQLHVREAVVRAYELELYGKQGARSAGEVDRLLEESEKAFIKKANDHDGDDGPVVRRKKVDGSGPRTRMKSNGNVNAHS